MTRACSAHEASKEPHDPHARRDDADNEQDRGEKDEGHDTPACGFGLGRCGKVALEQVDVPAIRLDADVEQVTEHGNDTDEAIERDIAEHADEDGSRDAFLRRYHQYVA